MVMALAWKANEDKTLGNSIFPPSAYLTQEQKLCNMKTTHYRQCILERIVDFQTIQQTTWLPEKFAKEGEVLKLKDEADNWVDGWVVQSVGARRTDKENELNQTLYRRTRKVSDVPKGFFKKDTN